MDFKKNGAGLFMPAKAKGFYVAEQFRDGKKIDEWEWENTIVNEGLIALLNIGFAGSSLITNWYMGLFSGNYTPVSTDTASSIVGNATEFTGYSGGARPSFTPTAASQPTPTITNSAAKANFTFTSGGTLFGGLLISSATPGSNTGTLWSAGQFGSSKTVAIGDTLALGYSTSLASS